MTYKDQPEDRTHRVAGSHRVTMFHSRGLGKTMNTAKHYMSGEDRKALVDEFNTTHDQYKYKMWLRKSWHTITKGSAVNLPIVEMCIGVTAHKASLTYKALSVRTVRHWFETRGYVIRAMYHDVYPSVKNNGTARKRITIQVKKRDMPAAPGFLF